MRADFPCLERTGFSFTDLLDIVNPLQHIPFVSSAYREMTGDEIGAAPRVLGSTLFFGPIGTVGALANVVVEANTGQDITEHAAGLFKQDDTPADNTVASNAPDPVTTWAQAQHDWVQRQTRPPLHSPGPSKEYKRAEELPTVIGEEFEDDSTWPLSELAQAHTAIQNTRNAAMAYAAVAGLSTSGAA